MDGKVDSIQLITHKAVWAWGFDINFMDAEGRSFIRVYQYDDNKDNVYISALSVVEQFRKNGIASKMLEVAEQKGRDLGASIACLQVIVGSWMQEWYKRKGYALCENSTIEDNHIWMQKTL